MKKSLVTQIEDFSNNYSDVQYEKLLTKVLNSKNREAMYMMIEKFKNAPIEKLEAKMIEKDTSFINTAKNVKWKIKITNLTNNKNNLQSIWNDIKKVIANYNNFYYKQRFVNFDEIIKDIYDYVSLDGVCANDVYKYLVSQNIVLDILSKDNQEVDKKKKIKK